MSIFSKLYKEDAQKAYKDIMSLYQEKWYLVVNYLYFANMISNWLLGNKKLNKPYYNSLIWGDFLLPDWIAMKLYYQKYFSVDLHNLNWTDFSDYLLKNLPIWSYNLILYWAKSEIISKASRNAWIKYDFNTYYFQDWYSDFKFDVLKKVPTWKINILMVWLWTPKQEIWVNENIELIKEYKLLVFTQGWTFDFWSWNEKRAPKIFIKYKLEWLWRFITNPKKNFKKVMYSFYLINYLWKNKK